MFRITSLDLYFHIPIYSSHAVILSFLFNSRTFCEPEIGSWPSSSLLFWRYSSQSLELFSCHSCQCCRDIPVVSNGVYTQKMSRRLTGTYKKCTNRKHSKHKLRLKHPCYVLRLLYIWSVTVIELTTFPRSLWHQSRRFFPEASLVACLHPCKRGPARHGNDSLGWWFRNPAPATTWG